MMSEYKLSNYHRLFKILVAFYKTASILSNFDEDFSLQKLRLLCFGLHTFLPSIVRQQRFGHYGHEEMRGDSPHHACLRLTQV